MQKFVLLDGVCPEEVVTDADLEWFRSLVVRGLFIFDSGSPDKGFLNGPKENGGI